MDASLGCTDHCKESAEVLSSVRERSLMASIGNDKLINSLRCFCYNGGAIGSSFRATRIAGESDTRRS